MSEALPTFYPAPPRSPAAALRRVAELTESIIGVVFCWAIGGVALVIPATLVMLPSLWVKYRHSPPPWSEPFGWLVAFFICLIHIPLFPVTLRALRRRGALGVEAALLSPKWPNPMRWLSAIWWTLMFLLGVFFGVSLEISTYMTPDEWQRYSRVPFTDSTPINPLVLCLSTFGMAFACNTFLLLAAASLTRSEPALRKIWRLRLLIDLFAVLFPAWLQASGNLH